MMPAVPCRNMHRQRLFIPVHTANTLNPTAGPSALTAPACALTKLTWPGHHFPLSCTQPHTCPLRLDCFLHTSRQMYSCALHLQQHGCANTTLHPLQTEAPLHPSNAKSTLRPQPKTFLRSSTEGLPAANKAKRLRGARGEQHLHRVLHKP
jgi:hypothetical protein